MFRRLALFTLSLFLLALPACNLPQRVQGTLPADAVLTAAAYTVAVEMTRMASVSLTPQVLVFPESPLATPTPSILEPTPSPVESITASLPCDRAAFVDDITYPDDSTVTAGSTFIKTWRLRNNGSCTWTAAYLLVFERGDPLGAPASVPLTTGTVAPGEMVDISVTLTAPLAIGTFQGFFQLRNAAGVNFGVGSEGRGNFWVKVTTIPLPTAAPAAWQASVPAISPRSSQWLLQQVHTRIGR